MNENVYRLPTETAKLRWIDPATWQGKPVPNRQWIVQDLIPQKNVTMLAGDGGVGKSQLALQLMVAAALGQPWLGLPTIRARSIGLFCEDDEDELHRRVESICRFYGVELADLEDVVLLSRVGLDNALMEYDGPFGKGDETRFMVDILNEATDYGAQVVVVDSLHDVFPGNENSRPQARQFIQALRTIATETNGAVILTAHPSLSGRNTGTGEAGSTAWNNAVRSRLYLTRPAVDEESEADQDARVLKTMKSNYSATSGALPLEWRDGVFAAVQPEQGIFATIEHSRCEQAFLSALKSINNSGREVNDSVNGNIYAPRVMRGLSATKGIRKYDLERAMNRLFERGEIVLAEAGTPSKRRKYIVRKGDGNAT